MDDAPPAAAATAAKTDRSVDCALRPELRARPAEESTDARSAAAASQHGAGTLDASAPRRGGNASRQPGDGPPELPLPSPDESSSCICLQISDTRNCMVRCAPELLARFSVTRLATCRRGGWVMSLKKSYLV
eukprot:365404-Chlamydomonas_euryale.AAC.7